ncbi:MAG: hypothetical protein L3J91_02915 [Thermoplasmata archaeon]|nr:hypothetical protein [Thermoplasmata archaeon]
MVRSTGAGPSPSTASADVIDRVDGAGPSPRLLVEVTRGPNASTASGGQTTELPAPPTGLPWGIGYADLPPARTLASDLERRPNWVRLPFHPLSPPTVDAVLTVARARGIGVISADTSADGRPDGRRLRGSPLESSGRPGPADWSEVRRTWAPVLALGFLTEGHRRTLPVASLEYVLGTPGVVAALVTAADSATLRSLGSAFGQAGLTAEERTRVDDLRAGRSNPSGASDAPELK